MPVSRTLLAACLGLAGFTTGTAGAASNAVHHIAVQPDKVPDCSSPKAIVQSVVTRGCKTNDEKAIALYNFMLLTHYHQGYPGEKGGLGALEEINVCSWSHWS